MSPRIGQRRRVPSCRKARGITVEEEAAAGEHSSCFSIAVDSAPVEFYVDVLRHCTNLETLTIEDPRELVWDFGNLSRPPLSPRSEDFAPAILPRLRTLVLTGAYVAELDFIRTPGLVNLHLKDLTAVDRLDPVRLFQPVGDTRVLDASQLRSIGQQGHCTLRSLTLEDGTVDFRMLARGLLPLQSLEYLGMSGMRVDVEYLAMLIAEAGEQVLHNLRRVELAHIYGSPSHRLYLATVLLANSGGDKTRRIGGATGNVAVGLPLMGYAKLVCDPDEAGNYMREGERERGYDRDRGLDVVMVGCKIGSQGGVCEMCEPPPSVW
ncbi:hypothetical protein DFP72DRAFT_1149346 [Ephemerocybe angulata]|uniref:Uncharacterized protein n=1 Tax=Ephemerocybe angulata TaxID=980116 RepID=A0A8H6M063_9AGAR|nr:hypothetical protein DFP72DRAFT_1149346 [Tulosesus angulatus]